ncbi:MAG: endonuclease/exonuclease/phosphatase family protein [Acidimicrobiia bacterium]|nr:endonuclease/exonuclease/phosphatase family protein [Acidimicrobiia bacterium]
METRARRFLLIAFGITLGFQAMRVLFASITWYLRDTVGVGTLDLIPYAIAPFLVGFALPAATRWLGVRNGLLVGAALLGAGRLAMQATGDPGVLFWAAALATAALVGLLPLFLSLGRGVFVEGVLLGLALDSLIKGVGGSLDLAYHPGWEAMVAALALVAVFLYLLAGIPGPLEMKGPSPGRGALLLGFGPFLFIEFLILQPQGWIAEVGGIPPSAVPVWVAVGNLAALLMVRRPGAGRTAPIVAALVVLAALILAEGPGIAFAPLHLFAVAAAGVVLAAIVPEPAPGRWWGGAVSLTGGTLLFLLIGLAYYLPMDIRLPMTQPGVRIGVGVALAAIVLFVTRERAQISELGPSLAGIIVVAAALPLISAAFDRPVTEEPTGLPIRIATYNIHSAFDTAGRLDVEAIALVIEQTRADVIGLQEVSRGRLINAGTDLYALLMDRLDMPYGAFFGTADPVWGNAILSRYPIDDVETAFLPTVDTPLRRGYLGVNIDIGDRSLLFISTHLQHVNDTSVHDDDPEADLYPVHHEQLAKVIAEWGGRTPAVLVGDLNARPGWRQVTETLEAGWTDAWEESGLGDGFTANAANPRYRIDWILHTGDLTATDAIVIESQASDHFAVAATLGG